MSSIYAGPGKVIFSATKALHAEGAGGRIVATRNDEVVPVASSLFGHFKSLPRDLTATITLTPFDDWAALPLLLPPRIGVTTPGGNTAALAVGQSPFESVVSATSGCVIWTPDGRSYPFQMAAVTGHPELHLGIDKALFGQTTITCIGDPAKTRDSATFLMGTNGAGAIAETGASDTGPALDEANIIRGPWTGAYGAIAGLTAIEAEDEWVIGVDVGYSFHKAQGLTRKVLLTSVMISARVRPVAGTHTQIAAALAGISLGTVPTSYDLVLTGPSSKTITVKNCYVTGGGFEFGGDGLGTGELVFSTGMTLTTGAADPLMIIA